MSVRSSSGSRVSIRSQKSDCPWQGNGVKSSGFYPVAMSPTARYNIVDHMNSHYRRIHAVKAAVDTSPPKSHQLRHSPSPSRQSSRPNSRSTARTDHSQYAQVNREEVLQTTNKINYYLDALKREQQRLISQVAAPNPHFRRPSSRNNAPREGPRLSQKPKDLLETHSQYFTTPEPFAPRLLRTDVKPRLQEYRWYNPPRRKDVKSNDVRERRLSERTNSSEYSERWSDEQYLEAPDKSPKIIGSSRSHQSKRSSSHESLRNGSEQWSRISDQKNLGSPVIMRNAAPLKTKDESLGSTNSLKRTYNLHMQQKEEDDEMKYLEFTVDVTNDILLRGIYTNKVLNQVFNSHLERKRNELSVEKMEKSLAQLRLDLGIEDDEKVNSQTFGYGLAAAEAHESKRISRYADIAESNGYLLHEVENCIEKYSENALDAPPRQTAADPNAQLTNGSKLVGLPAERFTVFATEENVGGKDRDRSENRTYSKHDGPSDTASEAEDLPFFEENGRGEEIPNGKSPKREVLSQRPVSGSTSRVQQREAQLDDERERLRSEEENSLSVDFYGNDAGDAF